MLRQRAGFTLIELLVVIAIIAVLAGILFPVFSRARESARRAGCLSNMQQIATAMKAYTTDYGGYLVNWCVTHPAVVATAGWPAPPSTAEKNDPQSYVITWDTSIMRYLKSAEVLKCKSNRNPRADVGQNARAFSMARYTQKVITGDPAWGAALGRFEGDFQKPSETVLLFEKGNNLPGSWGDACGENVFESHNGPLVVPYDPAQEDIVSGGETVNVRMFHFEGKNILYVDGHAKWCKATAGPFAQTGTSYAVPGMVFTEADLP
jgi:prepilin-type N-terminal cleavage/methylation domain-containing protein/prepilin-type processing-associated H-X9-DG protein